MEFSSSLIKALRAKETAAFEELYNMTSQMLLNYIRYKTSSDNDIAEDILSEVFCDVMIYSSSLLLTHNVKAWLLRIAKSKIVDYFRKENRNTNIMKKYKHHQVVFYDNENKNVEFDFMKKENVFLLKTAFEKLSENYKNIFSKRYIEEKPIKEIASILNKSEKSIETVLYRGRKKLSKEIESLTKEKIYFS